MNQLIQLKKRTLFVEHSVALSLLIVCLASGSARAVCQDGCILNQNTVQGDDALVSLTTGANATAFGFHALFSNTTANNQTATGAYTLAANTSGPDNTAYGAYALTANTTGGSNAAFGYRALFLNTTSGGHTAIGTQALENNTDGVENTATGYVALFNNTTGGLNVANGFEALANNTTGFSNTAVGADALQLNVTSGNNTAVGHFALRNSTGSGNTALGESAGVNATTGSNNIHIANPGVAGESNSIHIGTVGTQTGTFIAGIRGATVTGGIAVFVKANGKLGTNTSSRRFKDEIKPMDKASEAILALNPVSFRYKADLDPDGVPQFGLVAEEVEKVHPDLVVRDEKGEVYSVRYEAVNAMLLNEFLKEHRKVEQHEATIAELRKEMAAVNARLKEHEAKIEKVGARLEVSRPAPQLVDNE